MNVEILLVAIVTAIACSIIGSLLVLRGMSMITDAISHTVLLGIVIVYIFVPNLSSPFLIMGATVMGLITVYLVEILVKTKKTSSDAATGVVFPLLFSIAVIIISTIFKNTHLDVDAVLLGKLEFTVFERFIFLGIDLGPKSLFIMGLILVLLISFIYLLYKEIKLVIFDESLALALGFSVPVIHYAIVTGASLTAVAAFDVLGSILVIALMVGPAVTALLFTKSLKSTIVLSAMISGLNSVVGYFIALNLDLTVAGTISSVTLGVFLIVMIFAPDKGLISIVIRRKNQNKDFKMLALLYHIFNHDYNEDQMKPVTYELLYVELKWKESKFNAIINKALQNNYLMINEPNIKLTKDGISYLKRKHGHYFEGIDYEKK